MGFLLECLGVFMGMYRFCVYGFVSLDEWCLFKGGVLGICMVCVAYLFYSYCVGFGVSVRVCGV